MKQAESAIIYGNNYNDFPIYESEYGLYRELVENIFKLHDYTTIKHNKVLFTLLTLTFPHHTTYDTSNNNVFTNFLESLIRHLKRDGLDPYYLWVREQNESTHPHYHLVLWLNGSKVQSIYSIFNTANELWCLNNHIPLCLGLVQFNEREPVIMIRRDSNGYLSSEYFESFKWATYCAKCATKSCPPGVRMFGMSRLSNINEVCVVQ